MNDPATPNETTEEIDLTDRQIGDYRLLRRLGRGGMADVYLAEQKSLKRNVALKVLKSELAKDASYVKRFEREAQAAAALVQANIVQIYEVGRDDNSHYIAQEYVRGRNLKQYLDRHGAVEPVMAVNVLRQSALAIQKAHELGVIHRDIKPENIMLSTKGEVKITDFGLARINNSEAEQALTQIGVTMGTPLYMSPEQIGGLSLDHRSDIYSLGVTAYHMLAGEPPFNGDTALAIAIQHVNDRPKDLAVLRPDVPLALVQIISKMMAKKPADRPADPKQLLKELRAVKIDVDEDWEMIVEKLSVTELANASAESTSFSQAQLAATRQLQQVMRGNVRSWWRSKGLWIAVVLSGVLGLGGGLYWANQTPPVSLLNVEDIANEKIPKQESIVKQYHMAVLAPMDQHEVMLKKVLEYFPVSEAKDKNLTAHYHRNTYARLAEWYVINSRWREAEELFTKLSNLDGLAESFQVMGYAGQAIAFFNMPATDFQGGSDEQNERIGYAILNVAGRESMLNPMISQLFEEVLEGNRQLEELGRDLFQPHVPNLDQQNDAN